MKNIVVKKINYILHQRTNLASSIRFIVVGSFATFIHYITYLLLLSLVSKNISYTVGYIFSFLINFYLTSFFTFKSEVSVKRSLGFTLSHLFNYGIQMAVFNLYLYLTIPKEIVPLFVFLTTVPMNFLLIKFVFEKLK